MIFINGAALNEMQPAGLSMDCGNVPDGEVACASRSAALNACFPGPNSVDGNGQAEGLTGDDVGVPVELVRYRCGLLTIRLASNNLRCADRLIPSAQLRPRPFGRTLLPFL